MASLCKIRLHNLQYFVENFRTVIPLQEPYCKLACGDAHQLHQHSVSVRLDPVDDFRAPGRCSSCLCPIPPGANQSLCFFRRATGSVASNRMSAAAVSYRARSEPDRSANFSVERSTCWISPWSKQPPFELTAVDDGKLVVVMIARCGWSGSDEDGNNGDVERCFRCDD